MDIPFGFPIQAQGEAFESALDATGALGSRLDPGSKTFDFLNDVTGEATSVKTINTLTDAKLKNPSSITQILNRHIDAVINLPRFTLRVLELSLH